MSETKQIKFQFVVDQGSAREVNRVLDQMIEKAKELGKTLQGVGGQGGGGIMGSVRAGSGTPSSQSTLAGKGGSSSQKSSFTSLISGNAEGFKKMAQEGGAAMKAMTDALKSAAGQQQSAVDKLGKELDHLGRIYDRVGGKASKAFGQDLQTRILNKNKELQAAKGELSKLRGMEGDLMPGPRDDVAPPPAKLGGLARFRGFLNQGGGIGGAEVSAAGLAKVPGIGGLLGGAGGLAGGAMFAGASAAAAIGVKAAMSQASAAWNNQLISGQARAEFGREGPSSYARKLRAGDLSDVRSMQDIMQDQDKSREYREIQDPGWIRRQGNRWSAMTDAFSERGFKEGFSELFTGTEGVNYQKNLRKQQKEKLDMTTEERGVIEDIFADATGNAKGKMSTMRALGVGDGYKKGGGAYRSNAERLLLAFNQFDPGEVVAAVQGVSGAGTRGAAYANKSALLSSSLQAQAAGIGGAATMGGVFSRQGAQQGTDFVDLVRTIAGKGSQGGADVSVAALLGNVVAQKADQMNTPGFTGAGLLGQLSYGAQGAGGAMIARQNVQGQEEIQRLYTGERDAAQKAMNLLAAKKAAPDAGFYAQQYLATKLDASRIAEVQSGKFDLTDEEKALGISPSMIRQTVSGMKDSRKFRTVQGGFAAGSAPAKWMEATQGGMRAVDYARKTFMGKDEKWSREEEEEAASVYATTLRASDPSLSWSKAMGTARQELFATGRRVKKGGKGELAGDVAGASLESKIAKDEAERRKVDVDIKDAYAKKIEDEQTHTAEAYKRLVTNSSNLAITADNITDIIKGFAGRLRQAAGGGPPTNTKAKPQEK